MLNYDTNEQGISIGSIEENPDSSKYFSRSSSNNGNLKNVIMDMNDASLFVTENDANVLSNIVFEKSNTVAVPILIDRLQAGAGLISVGSIVDIYTLSNSNYQIQPNEDRFAFILNKYGLKLSDYERKSSLGEIDVQYLLLIEVPKEDVSHVINNMDNIVLTMPTSNAPNWMINELKETYKNS